MNFRSEAGSLVDLVEWRESGEATARFHPDSWTLFVSPLFQPPPSENDGEYQLDRPLVRQPASQPATRASCR